MLPNTIAVANGKGGVGKTSLAANLAGLAAISGWRVLLVDLDPQGNLSSDLGYTDSETNDEGESLKIAIENGEGVKPILDVRPGLDVVAGGDHTVELEQMLLDQYRAGELDATQSIDVSLASIASDYNLIVIDCPPSMSYLVDLAFTAARFVVVPTRGDAASLNGLSRTAAKFIEVRSTTNPSIDLLGVALFNFGTQDTRLVQKARTQLEEALQGIAPVFDTFIRNSRKGPDDMRELGLLAHEYHQTADTAPKWYEDPSAERYSQSSSGLAEDYTRLVGEILAEFTKKQTENPLGN